MSVSSNNPSFAIIEACQPSIGIIDKKAETVKSQFFSAIKNCGAPQLQGHGTRAPHLADADALRVPMSFPLVAHPRFFFTYCKREQSPSPPVPFPWEGEAPLKVYLLPSLGTWCCPILGTPLTDFLNLITFDYTPVNKKSCFVCVASCFTGVFLCRKRFQNIQLRC